MAIDPGAGRGAAGKIAPRRAPLRPPGENYDLEHADFSVVIKNRASGSRPWRWEIYRAGRKSPIECSAVLFATMTEANQAGKKALERLLTEFPA